MTSAEENAIVLGVLKSVTAPATPVNGWIGASDTATEGTWVWVDGSPFSFTTNWHTNQPGGAESQNCMRMRQTDGKWDDLPCDGTATKAFVCKTK